MIHSPLPIGINIKIVLKEACIEVTWVSRLYTNAFLAVVHDGQNCFKGGKIFLRLFHRGKKINLFHQYQNNLIWVTPFELKLFEESLYS